MTRQVLWICCWLAMLAGCSDQPAVYKGLFDRAQYQYQTLDNGLLVMLISDTAQTQTAMALSVHAGGWQDPDSHPGLAHALEHWLFLGNETNPTPNGLQHWLAKHGGQRNAMTSSDSTTYLLQVQPEVSEGALGQLQAMLQSPCLSLDPMRKEIHAIEAEFQRGVQRMPVRLRRVRQHLWDKTQRHSKFIAGNQETLLAQGEEALQQAAQDFFQTYYHPQNSTLAVVSPLSLEVLKEQVQNTLGQWQTSVPVNAPQRKEHVTEPPLLHRNTWIDIQCPQSREQIHIRWALIDPDQDMINLARDWQQQFSQQSEGFLNHWLKIQGWGNASAQTFDDGPHRIAEWSMNLTELGESQVEAIYQYFWAAMSQWKQQSKGEHQWMQKKQQAQYVFQYRNIINPLGFAGQIAQNLAYQKPELICSQGLRGLSLPINAEKKAAIVSTWIPEYSEVLRVTSDVQTEEIEPIYHTYFAHSPLTTRVPLQSVGKPWLEHARMTHRSVDDRLSPVMIKPTQKGIQTDGPMALPVEESMDVSYRYVPESLQPKAIYSMAWRGGTLAKTPEDWWSTKALIYAWNEQINMEQSTLEAWQAHVHIQYYVDSFEWFFKAPVQGMGSLSSWAISHFLDSDALFTEERLSRFKQLAFEAMTTHWSKASPMQRVHRELIQQQYQRDWSDEQHIAAIEQLTLEQLKTHWLQWSQQTYKMALLEGAISLSDAQAWVSQWQPWLDNQQSTMPADPIIWEKAEQGITTRQIKSDQEGSVFVEIWHAPRDNERAWLMTQLLGEYLAPKWFSVMRTEKQLAYALGVQAQITQDGYPYLMWLLESSVAEPEQIESEMQDFLIDIKQQLALMTEETWAPYKAAMTERLQARLRRKKSPWRRDWNKILKQDFDFYQEKLNISALETVHPSDLTQFFQQIQHSPLQGLKVTKALGDTS